MYRLIVKFSPGSICKLVPIWEHDSFVNTNASASCNYKHFNAATAPQQSKPHTKKVCPRVELISCNIQYLDPPNY